MTPEIFFLIAFLLVAATALVGLLCVGYVNRKRSIDIQPFDIPDDVTTDEIEQLRAKITEEFMRPFINPPAIVDENGKFIKYMDPPTDKTGILGNSTLIAEYTIRPDEWMDMDNTGENLDERV